MIEKQKEVLRVLLKHYTKIGLNGGIAKVIFDDDFDNIAEEIVKLFAIPDVIKSVCPDCKSTDIFKHYGGMNECVKCGYEWQTVL